LEHNGFASGKKSSSLGCGALIQASELRPTPTPAGNGSATRAQARFARNGAKMRRSLAGPAAAVEPSH